jgi:hypothetical protein
VNEALSELVGAFSALYSGDSAPLDPVLAQPGVKRLLSTDYFSAIGTLCEAWVSMKSFKPMDGSDEPHADGGGRNRETDFSRQEKHSNDTDASRRAAWGATRRWARRP